MVEGYAELTIGISSFILALLGFFQFVTTYMKTSNETINKLEEEKRNLLNDLEKITDDRDLWKRRAYGYRKRFNRKELEYNKIKPVIEKYKNLLTYYKRLTKQYKLLQGKCK